MLKEYYALAKPGLVYGNLIPVIAGFLLGAHVWLGYIDLETLTATIIGIAFVMGSGCVFNNIIDADIDGSMERTKERSLVVGRISKNAALIFGACLGIAGFGILALWTNFLAAAAAAVGFFVYVALYTIWAKRRTTWSTAIGSIAGATPPVVGYCAASGRFDLAAILLFAILVLWQIPHFYSIAIYRRDDYAAAKIPVLPVRQGINVAKINILIYIIAFLFVAPLLAVFGYAGNAYFIIATILGLIWLGLGFSGFQSSGAAANQAAQMANDKRWARRMFFVSLIVMVTLFLTLAIGAL